MTGTTTIEIDNSAFKGSIHVPTGLFIDGKWVDPVEPDMIDPSCLSVSSTQARYLSMIYPIPLTLLRTIATGKKIAAVALGSSKDVDIAVKAAQKAYKTTWGLKCPGSKRGRLLTRLADLLERDIDQFAALESINAGKPFAVAKGQDMAGTIQCIRYFGGWADKVHGKTIESNENKLAYTRHEPYGVVGQIIPWNFPMLMLSWKVGPALATGNCIVLKPSEMTPLSALKFAELTVEAGFPPRCRQHRQWLREHMQISKVAFTGSTLVGRKVLEASAKSNLKVVTLELGGKSPTVIFDDCNLEQTIKWATQAMYGNMGKRFSLGGRLLTNPSQDSHVSLDRVWAKLLATPSRRPHDTAPQVSKVQFDRIMGYIASGKESGATVHIGGDRHGTEGYFIQPTIFTDCTPDMKIVKEEIFGPVAAVLKFKTEEEVIEAANATDYGLSACVFSENVGRALRVAHAFESGQAYVNSAQLVEASIPFGGYKSSGIGREHGEYALETYTQVKAVHVNIGLVI
ncbi:Aldehyde dehydrogenase 5 [Mycena venus]|uniref:Aldehyde dehydrogenase 5 n=1 Tax=Mycena venus TaxID=2733690 RepID=A0A8H6Z2K3_9AGAR|nr:Aldehyde dehydrogenase 5 [Mycena venus]